MGSEEIWGHLSKELAKANTLVDLSQKIFKSVLFTRSRYNIFIATVLDSYTRVILLSIHHLFDEKYSWSLYDLPELSDPERNKIQGFRTKARKYIDVRHKEVGHSSRKVKLEQHKRLQWLPAEELLKIEELFKGISKMLNAYGMRKFNQGYSFHFGGPDTSLQCLIEDLEFVGRNFKKLN